MAGQAGVQALRAHLADHRAITAGIHLGDLPVVPVIQRNFLHSSVGGQHRVPVKAWVIIDCLVQEHTVVEICRLPAAPVQGHVDITLQGGQQDRLDACITGARSEQDHGHIVIVLPGTGTKWPFQLQQIASLQVSQQRLGEETAAHLANLKDQAPIIFSRQVGDRETPRITVD